MSKFISLKMIIMYKYLILSTLVTFSKFSHAQEEAQKVYSAAHMQIEQMNKVFFEIKEELAKSSPSVATDQDYGYLCLTRPCYEAALSTLEYTHKVSRLKSSPDEKYAICKLSIFSVCNLLVTNDFRDVDLKEKFPVLRDLAEPYADLFKMVIITAIALNFNVSEQDIYTVKESDISCGEFKDLVRKHLVEIKEQCSGGSVPYLFLLRNALKKPKADPDASDLTRKILIPGER
jgi:hypothetical protein